MREKIKKYLNNTFLASDYYNKVKGQNKVAVLKEMTFAELDFVDALKKLFEGIKSSYNLFESKEGFVLSPRQKNLVEVVANINNDIKSNDKAKTNNVFYIELIEDFYWQVYDYFDDYGNQDETVYKEEIDVILPQLENFLSENK